MRKCKKINALFLTFALLTALLAGCTTTDSTDNPAGGDNENVEPQLTSFTLAFHKSGGTNPYLSDSTITYQNASLLYGELVTISPSFELQMTIAENIMIAGNTVTVQLANTSFADGSIVTAQDVAASINAARSSSIYGGRLTNVANVQATGSSVIITLNEPDSMFAYLLDIPIMKAAEATADFPVGSGRYTPSRDGDGNLYFSKNSYYNGPALPIDRIDLMQLSGQDALTSSLNIGDISLYSSELEYDSGSTACKTVFYKTNNLVFLGYNHSQTFLQNPLIREALSLAVNRNILCDKAYYSRAYPATGLFNPTYPVVNANQYFSADAEIVKAQEKLAEAGFSVSELEGVATDVENNRLSLRLLVCTQGVNKRYLANLLKEQLFKVGITLEIEEVATFEEYTSRLTAGTFDMYIGEVKLYNNMDMSLFLKGGSASYGLAPTEELVNAYNLFKGSSSQAEQVAALTAFEDLFSVQMPFMPLLYRYGIVSYNRKLDGVNPSISDVFYQFEKLKSVKE